ncbi:MAG: tRNA (adenosine(37)-N6)-dimethylallyltransferase MiaA [Aeromicrobium sp.]
MSSDQIVAIIGPTAAGKSDLAVDLARSLGSAEIINVDSMQVYRGMDIGTAKLSADRRGGIRHHLLDILDITEPATVAEFQAWARQAVEDCLGRGVVPILVGGSALYIRAVLDKFEFPGTDPAIRAKWDADLAARGPEALHAELAERDPAAAAHLLPTNGRRIVRALEVLELTGKPYAATLPELEYAFDNVTVIGIDVPREVLNDRIAQRVDLMWEQGLVDEVRALRDRGLEQGRTASRALGYAQVLDFLRGDLTEDEAREATVIGTRKFARRQDQWFRKDPRIHWLPYDAEDRLERANAIVAVGRRP